MKNLFIALSLMFSVFALSAQERAAAPKQLTVEQQVEKTMNKLTEKLSLTAEQSTKVKTFITGYYNETERLASLKASDNKAYVKQITDKAQGYIAEIKKVLNSEQNQIFATMIDKLREKSEKKN